MISTEIFELDDSAAAPLPAALDVSDDDVPPAGTPCAGCKSMSHWCPAKCYRGESTALCRACANGVDCDVVIAKIRAAQISESGDIVIERFERPPAPCRSITIAPGLAVQAKPAAAATGLPYTPDPEALRMPKREMQRERYARPVPQLPPVRIVGKPKELPAPKVETPWNIETVRLPEPKKSEGAKVVTQFSKVTEAIKEQIRNAPKSESSADLAVRLNIAPHNIWYWRNGKHAQPARTIKAAQPSKPAKPVPSRPSTSSNAIDIVDVAQRLHAMGPAPAPVPVPAPEVEGITVSVVFTNAGMDAWWNRLTLAEKAKIALGNITF